MSFDLNDNIKFAGLCISALTAIIVYIKHYFKNKQLDKEEFITKIVNTTIKQTVDLELNDIKESIKILFQYREEDRKNSDNQFKELLKEIRK